MLEGVLDEGLHDERRHESAHRARLERVAHGEPVAETNLLDRQVLLDERELRLEWQLGLGGRVEGEAEKLCEAREHEVRGLRVAVDEDADRVERVEEKVRLELHAQRLQLGERELPFERDALAVLPHVVIEDETEDDQIAWSVLKRKCGWSCMRSAFSSASASCPSSATRSRSFLT